MNLKQTALTISKQDALRLFPTASPEFKVMLISTFGEAFFKQDIIDRLKDGDLDDCCELTALPKVSSISEIPEKFHKWLIGQYHGAVICEAFNEGEKLSYLNKDQKKHYPWFDLSSGGLAFVIAVCNNSIAGAGDASRLRVKSDKAARVMGENPNFQKVFLSIIED